VLRRSNVSLICRAICSATHCSTTTRQKAAGLPVTTFRWRLTPS
jgi:hypothetical protein